MKKKIYLILAIISIVALFSSCRGFKSAPPCPAYGAEVSTTNSFR